MMQNKGKVIGIAGGICSGKSEVSKILADLGFNVIDSDTIAKDVISESDLIKRELVLNFGNVLEEGRVDYKTIGKIVFNDEEKLTRLNSITHPFILERIKKLIEESVFIHDYTFVESALMFSSGLYIHMDLIINVVASEIVRTERLMKRSHLNYEEARNRIVMQKNNAKGPVIDIENEGSLENLKTKVIQIIRCLND